MKKTIFIFFTFIIMALYTFNSVKAQVLPPDPSINGCYDGAEVHNTNKIHFGNYRYACEVIVWDGSNYIRFTSDNIINGIEVSGLYTSNITVTGTDLWWVYIAKEIMFIPIVYN